VRLPLFVLPIALLPGALLPLHVFEPRYRRMVARCLERDRRFGLLYHPAPAEFVLDEGLIGCIAEIQEFRPLPDGRSLMLVRGTGRFRTVDGIENNENYHEALVDELEDAAFLPGDIAERRARVLTLIRRHLAALPAEDGEGIELPAVDEGDISFGIAALIAAPPEWHQALLELPTERARLSLIEQRLTE